jgi:peptidoglycan-associated lipoprotein
VGSALTTVMLRWQVIDATEIEIDEGVGTVSASGTRGIAPQDTITHTLRATGPGGKASATASIQVTIPEPPHTPPSPVPALSLSERIARDVADLFFDFDQHDLREDALGALNQNAVVLQSIFGDFPAGIVTLEGHCDERGSTEYNVGLGDRRAHSAREYLKHLGIPEDRLSIVSYGKERPQCSDSDEACWQKNRRVHFTAHER